ncbi:glycosyltransferase [Pantoea cypripedii]|uniref:Glycosyl transferase family 1 n=1 Tax=Pantoea cypripedii TaxID=55209 RepID=A0A1X1EJL8_PANCY|nr:glycosyltransferase [Pantoea cypripedii]MBP2200332.1 glycosyltransferase involved in cell wall biosynthesis [Pantoea cypripedii]ORM89140.1 glycosyl transferase family 1 [Pantoea cypripedii]
MKKILIACRAYFPDIAGGGEISTKTLSETLVELGFDVTILAISDGKKNEEVDGVVVHRIKHKNVYWSFKNKEVSAVKKIAWHLVDSNNIFIEGELKRVLSEVNPDILITSTIEDVSSIIWKVSKKMNIRNIHILRSYSLLCPNANMFKEDNCKTRCALCKTVTLPKRINSSYVDDVVGISHFVADEHLRYGYFPNAKKHVIYNICLGPVLEERIYNGFKKDSVRIGYLGRIHKTKGIDIIFSALGKIEPKIRDKVEVEIAGSGERKYIEELKIIASTFGVKCTFLGNTNANDFLDRLDMLIVPSKWNEPFGRVLIESMGRNVPVAGKKVGGIPELLVDNTDFLFDDEIELVDLISKFVKGEIEFNFNLDEFKTESIISQWSDLLM